MNIIGIIATIGYVIIDANFRSKIDNVPRLNTDMPINVIIDENTASQYSF
ncbi:hypothetical protein SAMN05216170_1697 [Thermococcus thioreducens]|uniref:Uncharacterized protein n=1 Tax=Thermococcus thioreducens TaxID=277988 RepID=A0A1I0PBT1_9EURY|nr:hypothetical protein SAMN05216170_1697 [Thermococcus thioreducens]